MQRWRSVLWARVGGDEVERGVRLLHLLAPGVDSPICQRLTTMTSSRSSEPSSCRARSFGAVILVFAGLCAEVWAGPAEEVLQIADPRVKALEEGNLDAYMAAFADNAVFHSADCRSAPLTPTGYAIGFDKSS